MDDDDETRSGASAASDDETMAELAELRAKVALYEAQLHRSGSFRRIGYWLLLVLSVVGIIASTIGVWSRATLLDSDQWAETVRPLVQDETVSAAVGSEIATGIVDLLDVEAALAETLPDAAGLLAGPVTGALRDLLADQAAQLLRTEAFADLWAEANRISHGAAVRVLEGGDDDDLLVTEGDRVVIDFVPLIVAFLSSATDTVSSFLPDDVELPDPAEVDLDELRIQLEEALGVEIPEDFGTVTVYESDVLPQAQDAVRLLDRGVVLLVIATALAVAGTFLLSPDRRRTLVIMAGSVAGLVVVLWMLREPVGTSVLSSVAEGQPRDVAGATLRIVFRDLRSDIQWVFVVALVSLIAGYLAGPSDRAVRFRAAVRSALDRVGGDEPIVDPRGAVASFVRAHRDALGIAGVVVAFVVVTALDRVTWLSFLVVLVVLAAYEAALFVLSRNGTNDDVGGEGVRLGVTE